MTAKQSRTAKSGHPIIGKEATNNTGEDIRKMIAEAAYFHAEHRDFQGGNMDEDWYLAEAEIELKLSEKEPH